MLTAPEILTHNKINRIKESLRTSLIAYLKDFSNLGQRTIAKKVDGVDYYINEFWTPQQRKAHRLHEISYRACFKAQLPAFFIKLLTEVGDIVYDPFAGRGTTLIEAALHNRIPYGNDINPLSQVLVEPRLNPPPIYEIVKRLRKIPFDKFTQIENQKLLVFYHPKVLSQLEGLSKWFIQKEQKGHMDPIDHWIRMVTINRLSGHSSGFLSVYTLPPNQAISVERQQIINSKKKQIPPEKDIATIVKKKSQILVSQGTLKTKNYLILRNQSQNTPEIPDETVSLTITSPPFLDVVDYEKDNWLRCWFLGIDPKKVNISQYKNVEEWTQFIAATLKELARITKPGGYVAFEVGEVRKGTIRLEKNVIQATQTLPFQVIGRHGEPTKFY